MFNFEHWSSDIPTVGEAGTKKIKINKLIEKKQVGDARRKRAQTQCIAKPVDRIKEDLL